VDALYNILHALKCFKAVGKGSTAAHFSFLLHVEKVPLILISKWLICGLTKDMVNFVKIEVVE
jgi:hypothetical protein